MTPAEQQCRALDPTAYLEGTPDDCWVSFAHKGTWGALPGSSSSPEQAWARVLPYFQARLWKGALEL